MALFVDIKKSFGKFCLDVEFNTDNSILALLGASGCGKSVTLKCIAGIETPDEGRIVLDNKVLFDSEKNINLSPQKRKIGYLFQQYALFPNMTAERNILTGVSKNNNQSNNKIVAEVIKMCKLDGLANKYPHQLSGGQQQRVALARILVSQPSVILLDEPFSALDSYLKWQLEMELSDLLKNFGGTVIWVSHDRDEVYRNCSHVTIMDNGYSHKTMLMKDFFCNPGTKSAAQILGCKNYVEAKLISKGKVYIRDWDVEIQCDTAEDINYIGLGSHNINIAKEDDVNKIYCKVIKVVEDVFSMIVMVRPAKSSIYAQLLRMDIDKNIWGSLNDKENIVLSINPKDILLLR